MSKLTEMVRLEDLALEYQRIIGNRFNIGLNFELDIDNTKERAFMLATRQPYKISNLKAESLQVVLRFYTCSEYKNVYNDTIQILSQLVGLCKGTFQSNGNTYRYFSFLDFTRPLTEPEVDTGKFYQTLEIMGTCLVTQVQGGVLIGNEIETEITFNPDDATKKLTGKLEVLASSTSLTKTQEAPLMSNDIVAKAFNNTQAYSYSYSVLMLRNEICERIYKGIKNIEPFELNEKMIITETSPEFVEGHGELKDTKIVVLTGAQIDKNAGTFTTATLTFQDWLNLDVLEEME